MSPNCLRNTRIDLLRQLSNATSRLTAPLRPEPQAVPTGVTSSIYPPPLPRPTVNTSYRKIDHFKRGWYLTCTVRYSVPLDGNVTPPAYRGPRRPTFQLCLVDPEANPIKKNSDPGKRYV
jgi:hypothetical protein